MTLNFKLWKCSNIVKFRQHGKEAVANTPYFIYISVAIVLYSKSIQSQRQLASYLIISSYHKPINFIENSFLLFAFDVAALWCWYVRHFVSEKTQISVMSTKENKKYLKASQDNNDSNQWSMKVIFEKCITSSLQAFLIG